jgi:hypothetical protein
MVKQTAQWTCALFLANNIAPAQNGWGSRQRKGLAAQFFLGHSCRLLSAEAFALLVSVILSQNAKNIHNQSCFA